MNLDHRAAQAAEALRDQIEPDLDVERAHAAVLARADGRRRRTALVRTAAVVAVIGALAGLVGLSALAGRNGDELQAGEFDDGLSARGAAILGGLPTSAIDGKDSWRLPVVADPQTGVTDGQVITVYGRGFEPNDSLGVVMCASEAETEGVGACQLGTDLDTYGFVTYVNADAQGNVVAPVPVRQLITTPATGPIDCRSAAERCLVGMGAISNYDRSGGTYVDFAGAPPFPEPALAIGAEGPYAPGQQVTALATDLVPGRPYELRECRDGICVPLAQGRADDDGVFAQTVTLGSEVPTDGGEMLACGEDCTLELTGVGPDGASSIPFPPPVPLTFTDGEAQPATPVTPDPSPLPPVLPPDPPVTTVDPCQGSCGVPSTVPPPTASSDPVPPSSGATTPSTTAAPTTEVPTTTR